MSAWALQAFLAMQERLLFPGLTLKSLEAKILVPLCVEDKRRCERLTKGGLLKAEALASVAAEDRASLSPNQWLNQEDEAGCGAASLSTWATLVLACCPAARLSAPSKSSGAYRAGSMPCTGPWQCNAAAIQEPHGRGFAPSKLWRYKSDICEERMANTLHSVLSNERFGKEYHP